MAVCCENTDTVNTAANLARQGVAVGMDRRNLSTSAYFPWHLWMLCTWQGTAAGWSQSTLGTGRCDAEVPSRQDKHAHQKHPQRRGTALENHPIWSVCGAYTHSPYSLGIGGVTEAQHGKVQLTEGGGWQVLPEYEPPEVLGQGKPVLEPLAQGQPLTVWGGDVRVSAQGQTGWNPLVKGLKGRQAGAGWPGPKWQRGGC